MSALLPRALFLLGRNGSWIDAEIAVSPAAREVGLAGRTEMAENHGMFFDMGQRGYHAFWMRGTLLPLDVIFVDNGIVVGIVERAAPLDETPREIGRPSTHMLEVNAGWARAHGVEVGQRVAVAGRSGVRWSV